MIDVNNIQRESYRIAIDHELISNDKSENYYDNGTITKASYFNKRICYKAVEDSELKGVCTGCLNGVYDNPHSEQCSEWNYKDCTKIEPTDAYGKLSFPGSSRKNANYIRLEVETKPSDLVEFLYNKQGWNLNMPHLILSIIGGAQKFSIPMRIRKAFKRGLIKIASTTGAWIITGGINLGAMKLVGEAVKEEFFKDDLTLIGIAKWGKVALRNKLIRRRYVKSDEPVYYAAAIHSTNSVLNFDSIKRKTPDVLLDPNHTHFILVDDGSQNYFSKEIEFRLNFENELRKGISSRGYEKQRHNLYNASMSSNNSKFIPSPNLNDIKNHGLSMLYGDSNELNNELIPMVTVVVQGGQNTLQMVEEKLNSDIPVLILAETKGCADLITNAFISNKKDEMTLKVLIEDSRLLDNIKHNSKLYNKCMEQCIARLKNILRDDRLHLINIFRSDNEEDSVDIELAILTAFFNSRKTQYYSNLKLALKWNRLDIAKMYIFTGEEEFSSFELAHLMELALYANRVEFVDLLLENGVNIKSFLSAKRLYYLYNSDKIQNEFRKAPLHQLLKKRHVSYNGQTLITFKGIDRCLKELIFEDFQDLFIPMELKTEAVEDFLVEAHQQEFVETEQINAFLNRFSKIEIPVPELNLFIWSLLLNRIEMAKLFWKIGQNQIFTALFGCHLLRSISSRISDSQLSKAACEFENFAISILNRFYDDEDHLVNGIMLLRKTPFYNIDCLHMAAEAKCENFTSQPSIQNLLTELWHGKISHKINFKMSVYFFISCLSCGLLAPLLLFDNKTELYEINEQERTFNKLKIYYRKQNLTEILKNYLDDEFYDDFESKRVKNNEINLKKSFISKYARNLHRFISAPSVHFLYDTASFLTFLILFSYLMLCKFHNKSSMTTSTNTAAAAMMSIVNSVNLKNTSTSTTTTTTSKIYPNYINTYQQNRQTSTTNIQKNEHSWVEYLLIYWIFSIFCDEIRQYASRARNTKELRNQLLSYFADSWNYLDTFGCLIFTIGMALRFLSPILHENLFSAARIILCIDLMIWYMRLLHVSFLFKYVGPKLVMIQLMMRDLLFFMCIMTIFICAYGITTHATLYPGAKLDFNLFRSIVNKAYWPIYGDLRLLSEISHDCNTAIRADCPENTGIIFTFFAMMVYMIIANVLLVNLLIAMFSYTFQNIQGNTDKIWKFQRLHLVFEHFDSPIFPVPFNIFAYIIEFLMDKFRTKTETKLDEQSSNMNEMSNEDTSDIISQKERKYAEEHLNNMKHQVNDSVDSQLKSTMDRLEIIEQKLNRLIQTFSKEFSRGNKNIF